jgi:ATP-binding cassette subfamily B protein
VFRWALKDAGPYKGRLLLLVGLSTLEVLLRVLMPWPMKAVVDHAIGPVPPPPWLVALAGSSREALLGFVVILGLVIQVAHQSVLMAHTRLYTVTGHTMTRDIRQKLFMHLQALNLYHHSRTPVGDSVYRLEADASYLEQLLLRGLVPLTFSALTLIVMFAILTSINVSLALVSLAVVPFLFVWIRFSARRIRPGAERTRVLESRMTARLHESFAAIRLVKSFAREPYEGQRFSGAATEAMNARVSLSTREAIFSSVVGNLIVLGSSLVVLVGGLLVLQGTLTTGTLLVAMAYLGFVYGPLSGVANTTGGIQHALAAARRVHETMTLTPEMEDVGKISAGRLTGRVVFEHVSFAYRERPVLRDVSLSADPGELIAIVGPSGSGKTTLVSLIPRFYQPTSGRVLIDGIDVQEFQLRYLREQTAIVLQDVVILSGSIRDNIRYGHLEADDEAVERAARAAHAHDFITALEGGYDAELGEAGAGLSGGQKQRLSIARAFLKDAPILILDEPTAALDAASERLVFDAVRRLRTGRTTFVIAHRLSTVRDADRILVLNEGSLIAQGTHQTLMIDNELYRDLVNQLTIPGADQG